MLTESCSHWYLKQSVPCRDANLEHIQWSQEDSLRLYLIHGSHVDKHDFAWSTFRSYRQAPNDNGAVAVVDGGEGASAGVKSFV